MAAELLSHSTATALQYYLPGDDKELAVNVGKFIDMVNKWFDICNSYTKFNSNDFKCGYGIHLEKQNLVLDEMIHTISTMRPITKQTIQLFQKGIIMSTISLQQLFLDLKDRHNISYICTHRLNQDSLENFFFQLRSRGGPDDHPSPLTALHHIRMIILGKNPGILGTTVNTEDRVHDEYIVAQVMNKVELNIEQDPTIETSLDETNLNVTSSDSSFAELETLEETTSPQEEITNDSLEYIAGYLAKKIKNKYNDLGVYTHKLKTNMLPS